MPELARPISSAVLCGNGLKSRFESLSVNAFSSAETSLRINHWHSVDSAIWTGQSGSIESVMRTGAVAALNANDDCWPDLMFATGATTSGQLVRYLNQNGREFGQTLLTLSPSSQPIAGIGTADLDGDYRPDIAVGHLLAGSTDVYRVNDVGGFEFGQSIATSKSGFGFAFADYSGDEWLDAFVAQWDITGGAPYTDGLFANTGSASSQPPGTLVGADALSGTTPAEVDGRHVVAPLGLAAWNRSWPSSPRPWCGLVGRSSTPSTGGTRWP